MPQAVAVEQAARPQPAQLALPALLACSPVARVAPEMIRLRVSAPAVFSAALVVVAVSASPLAMGRRQAPLAARRPRRNSLAEPAALPAAETVATATAPLSWEPPERVVAVAAVTPRPAAMAATAAMGLSAAVAAVAAVLPTAPEAAVLVGTAAPALLS